jgi:hypothetical protein
MAQFSECLEPGQRINLELLQVELSREEEIRRRVVAELGIKGLLDTLRDNERLPLKIKRRWLKKGELSPRRAAQLLTNDRQG